MNVASSTPTPGYPSNCVGASNMTKEIAQSYYDSQRSEIETAMIKRDNPSKPSYTWPIIGLAVSTIATILVCRMKRKP